MSEPMPELGQSLNNTADNGNPVAADADQSADRRGKSGGFTPETAVKTEQPIREIGGPSGLEPTRYGDWEHKGRCIDF